MHKITIFLSCLICLAAAGRLGTERQLWSLQNVRHQKEEPTKMAHETTTGRLKQMQDQQLFLLDVLLQVHKPLLNQKLIELGKVLINDPALYTEPIDELLLEFLEKCRQHEILGRDKIYSDLNMEHGRQMIGLTKFLTLAKDWPTFQRNVCFARLHMNPVIFVNALLRAIRERTDTNELVVPAMNEILPQLFYDKEVIMTAESVDWHDLLTGPKMSVKPSLFKTLHLNRVVDMMSPTNWIHIVRSGRPLPWRAQTGNVNDLNNVERLQTNTLNDPSNIISKSEIKVVIPVEQKSPLSYLIDDVGLNIFWNEVMNERLIQTLTSEKQKDDNWSKNWGKNEQVEETMESQDVWTRKNEREKENLLGQRDTLSSNRYINNNRIPMERNTGALQQQLEPNNKLWEIRNEYTLMDRNNWGTLPDRRQTVDKILQTQAMQGQIGVKNVLSSNMGTESLLHVGRRHKNIPEIRNDAVLMERENRREPVWMRRQRMEDPKMEESTSMGLEKMERPQSMWVNHENNKQPTLMYRQPTQTQRGVRNEPVWMEQENIREPMWMGHQRVEESKTEESTSMSLGKMERPQSINQWLNRESPKQPTLMNHQPRQTQEGVRNEPVLMERENMREPVWMRRQRMEDPKMEESTSMGLGKMERPQSMWLNRQPTQTQRGVRNEPVWMEQEDIREPMRMGHQRMEGSKTVESTSTDREKMGQLQPMSLNHENTELPTWMNRQQMQIQRDIDTEEPYWKLNQNQATVRNGIDRQVDNERVVDRNTEIRESKLWGGEPVGQSIWDGDRLVSKRRMDEREHGDRMPRSIKSLGTSPTENLMSARGGEIFIQNLQQLMARINLEKMSLNLKEFENVNEIIAPQLLTTNGVQYQQRSVSQVVARQKIQQTMQQLQQIIDREMDNARIELNNPAMLRIIGDILIEKNGQLGNVWDELYNQINAFVYSQLSSDELQQTATVLSIPSGNLREPIYLDIVEGLNKLIDSYMQNLQPYTRDQLIAPGVVIKSIDVDQLVSYFDLNDADLINLVDQQLLQTNTNNLQRSQKQLVARQKRLNHKQFTFDYEILSERNQPVVVRTFIGPKINEPSRQMDEIRQNFMLLDAFVENLETGLNRIERNSRDITWTTRDTTTLNEIYRIVMHDMSVQNVVKSNCRFPHRLLIPRGRIDGFPMQLFVVVTPVTEEDLKVQRMVNPSGICGLGVAGMSLDTLPLNFPLDRKIQNAMEFLQDNMMLRNVLVMHDERVELGSV